MALEIKFINNLNQINPSDWNALLTSNTPFVRYEFLRLLEETGAVSDIENNTENENGWYAHHLCIFEEGKLVAALPLYKKTHWFGEYVFDWAWDEAYSRYGLNYYPKLTAAIPFTPVTGPRLLTRRPITQEFLAHITQCLEQHCLEEGFSSCHILFPEKPVSDSLTKLHWQQRKSVQFHWFNDNYKSFEDFLAKFASRKRKNVKKERDKIKQANIEIIRLHGEAINHKHMAFFYRCYQQTYAKRSGHIGYLSEVFFTGLLKHFKENLLLVVAIKNNNAVASALYFHDCEHLYGRYWGSLVDVDALHFECCYYQGIEFCIEQGLKRFNPGTQGEHKIQRGFTPIDCYSNHWLKDKAFHQAITHFIQEETAHLVEYKQQATTLLPFKRDA